LAHDMGVELVSVHRLHPEDYKPVKARYYHLLVDSIRKAAETAEKLGVEFSAPTYECAEVNAQIQECAVSSGKRYRCSFVLGNEVALTLDPLGNLRCDCQKYQYPIGNLAVETVDEIFSGELLRKLWVKMNEDDQRCCVTCPNALPA
jgi:hypothetical protein